MFVTQVTVRREGYYAYGTASPDKPFVATVELHGQRGKIELNLDPAMSKRIVDIIADEVAAAGRATAEAMTADVMNVKALPNKKL